MTSELLAKEGLLAVSVVVITKGVILLDSLATLYAGVGLLLIGAGLLVVRGVLKKQGIVAGRR